MSKIEQPVAAICIFIWVGFIGGISFLEAWLKFRAPGVTLPIGLGIGRLVFSALNKVEWVLAIAIITSILFSKAPMIYTRYLPFLIVLALLITQTSWLLPGLNARADLYITGKPVGPSNLHLYFIAAEGIKTICLIIQGITLFSKA